MNKYKWQGPALGARSCHLRFTPAAKSFSTLVTVHLVVCLKIHPAANSIVTLATITWRRPGGLILYCTVLFCTVLYKKRRMRRRKIRKFADNQSSNQTNTEQFKHWGYSNPLWIVGGAGQLYFFWSIYRTNDAYLSITGITGCCWWPRSSWRK